jgi:hypothetical protein
MLLLTCTFWRIFSSAPNEANGWRTWRKSTNEGEDDHEEYNFFAICTYPYIFNP